jgi:hypothetical protein
VAAFVPCRVRLRSLDAHRNASFVCHPPDIRSTLYSPSLRGTTWTGKTSNRVWIASSRQPTSICTFFLATTWYRPDVLAPRVEMSAISPTLLEQSTRSCSDSTEIACSTCIVLPLSGLSSLGACQNQTHWIASESPCFPAVYHPPDPQGKC